MAINDTYELAIRGTYHGQTIINTHHFREYAPWVGPPGPEQTLIDNWQTTLQTAWLNMFNGNYVLSMLTAKKVCGSLPLPIGVEESVGLPGNRIGPAGSQLPAWVALVVNERTSLRGRSYRGRFFIAGVQDEDVTGDDFVTTAGQLYALAGTYNTALLGLAGPSGSSPTWRLVVHSRKLAETPGIQCQQCSTEVTQLNRSLQPATMKSRKA